MAEYPEDVLVTSRKLCDDLIKAWLLHHSREEAAEVAAVALLAERHRPVTVASANDFPDAVFSSEQLANQYNEQQAATDPKVPRIYRRNATFVIDEKVKTTA